MSKLAIMVIGAVSVIGALFVFAKITQRNEPLMPAQARTISAPVERFEPVAPPAPVEPTAARVEPRLPPTPVALPSAPAPAEPDPGELVDDPAILAILHDLAASDPPHSVKLARSALQRFPDSPNAPEFAWNVVKALFNMGRIEDAKDEARIMVQEYPGSYFTGDVQRHLLNPPPNPP